MPPFSSMAVRIQGLKGRHRTAQGNALGFDAIIAIKRCKRATILLLTRRHSNVVAQVSQPAVGKPSFGSQVSKPACRFFSTTHPNLLTPLFSWGYSRLCPNGYEISGLNPNSEVGNENASTCREPIVGRARHSVRAAPATSACKISPASRWGCCS